MDRVVCGREAGFDSVFGGCDDEYGTWICNLHLHVIFGGLGFWGIVTLVGGHY